MTSTELATYYKSVVDLTDASKSYNLPQAYEMKLALQHIEAMESDLAKMKKLISDNYARTIGEYREAEMDAKPKHPKICPFMSRPVIYESPCVYAAPAVGQYESTSTLQYTFHKQPCLQEECMAWVPLKRDKEGNIIQYPRCRLIP